MMAEHDIKDIIDINGNLINEKSGIHKLTTKGDVYDSYFGIY